MRFEADFKASFFGQGLSWIFFLKLLFLGFSPECHAATFLQRSFLSPLCTSLLVGFTCTCFFTLKKCLTKIKLNKKQWLKSRVEAFYVEKSPKKWTKVFAEEILLCDLCRILFWLGQRKYTQEYACKVSKLGHFRSWSVFLFFKRKSLDRRWWTSAFCARRIWLIINCKYSPLCPPPPFSLSLSLRLAPTFSLSLPFFLSRFLKPRKHLPLRGGADKYNRVCTSVQEKKNM